jgi:ferritin
MIGKKMTKALTEQINKEMYSSYLYMAMSSHSDHIGLKGFAHWFMAQYQEEMGHAKKMYEYLQHQREHVELMALAKPLTVFTSPLDMFEKTLEHEKSVTKSIHALVDLAVKENDHATHIFLQWFVTEQIEEEASATDIISKLKLVGEKGNGLFMIDKMLATRE